jgi:hypothetical protein
MRKVHHMRDKAVDKTLNVQIELTYLLTPCCKVLLEKLTGFQLVKKFSAFYGTRRFITAFTIARHLSLSWASSIQIISSGPRLSVWTFRSVIYLNSELLALRPTPKFEGHPLSAVRDCIFYIFTATLHTGGPFLHPQHEDAPCRGDRDPLITENWT